MSVFHFCRFDVVNVRSAMKVNTDGVLLGALMTVRPTDVNSLDIGTGTGTIALMAAQRLSSLAGNCQSEEASESAEQSGFSVMGIDVDSPSAEEAAQNFSASPWPSALSARHVSLSEFEKEAPVFDHIFSNPPYFDSSLPAPEERRNSARHSQSMSYRDILEFSQKHLAASGVLSLVLPSDVEKPLLRYARMCGFHLFRIVRVRTVKRKSPSRIIAEFSRTRVAECQEEALTMMENGGYTDDYKALTADFYLWQ